jgi:serine/threonine-protein kinase
LIDQSRLDALLLRYEELRGQDVVVTPEDLCLDCPELVEELKRQIQALESMNAVLGGPSSQGTLPSASAGPSGPGPADLWSALWSAQPLSTGSRYELLRFHAKGGLGEVHVARDEALHRDVALKCLQKLHARNPQSRDRFLREAALTSRLEHPNIVPVHSVGQDAEGCPFYAMRFVQGQTLSQAIQAFHAADRTDREISEHRLALRQLLGQVVAVCNTLAYAHSMGIVHRDIKPDNIMLGKYGETLVLDWGLAKEMKDPGGAPDPGNQPEPLASAATLPGSNSPTETGAVIGTPAYMSPEQADGRLDTVGPASDVYSLGATLYAVLTGQSPFRGSHVGELLDRVKRGEFAPPRRLDKAIPRALEAICLKAMARQPEGRYAGALDLAADLEHWLADERVSALRESTASRLARWGRRHRALVIGAAALLLTAVALLTTGVVLLSEEQKRTSAAYDGLKREQQRTQEALVLLSEEQKRTALAYQELKHEQLKTQEALAAEAKSRRTTYEALELFSSQVVDEWLAKQTVLRPEHRQLLEKGLAYWEALARDARSDQASRVGAAAAYLNVGRFRWRLGQSKEAEAAIRRSRELRQELSRDFPSDPAQRLGLARTHNNLAVLLANTGRSADAEQAYLDGMKLFEELVAEFPNVPIYRQELATSHRNLGGLAHRTHRTDKAEQAYKEALAQRQRLANTYPRVASYQAALAESHNLLGQFYLTTGRPDFAEEACVKAEAIQTRLAKNHPAVPEYQEALADTSSNLAILDRDKGRTDSAERRFLAVRVIRQRLTETYPQVVAYQRVLAISHNNLGALYRLTKRAALAQEAYQQAQTIYQRLTTTYPEVADYALELGGICWNLGHVLRDDLGKPQEALDQYAGGIPRLEALLRKDRQNAKAREVLFVLYASRAVALAILGRHAEAARELRGAEEIDQGQSRGAVSYFGGDDIRLYRSRVLVLAGEHGRATADAEDLLGSKALGASKLVYLAGTHILAIAAAQRDTKLSGSARTCLGDCHAARAVELLSQARTGGYFRNPAALTWLRGASELAVLRPRADFVRLLRDVEDKEAAPD